MDPLAGAIPTKIPLFTRNSRIESTFYLRNMRNLSLLCIALLWSWSALGQTAVVRPRRSTPVPTTVESQRGGLIQVGLGGFQPSGFWRQRYGGLLDVQAGYSILNGQTLFGFSGGALYGSQVKDLAEVIDFLLTPEGEILANDGSYGNLRVEMRGWQISAHIGRRYALNPANSAKSTWYWKLHAGVMQHKMAFLSSGGVPMLAEPYSLGLDELKRGPYVSEEIGFMHLGRVAPHFNVSLVAFQGWTEAVRGYSFTLGGYQKEPKWDLGWGIRTTWILPMLQEKTAIRYYY